MDTITLHHDVYNRPKGYKGRFGPVATEEQIQEMNGIPSFLQFIPVASW